MGRDELRSAASFYVYIYIYRERERENENTNYVYITAPLRGIRKAAQTELRGWYHNVIYCDSYNNIAIVHIIMVFINIIMAIIMAIIKWTYCNTIAMIMYTSHVSYNINNIYERLAEHVWKPLRDLLARKSLSQASTGAKGCTYMIV